MPLSPNKRKTAGFSVRRFFCASLELDSIIRRPAKKAIALFWIAKRRRPLLKKSFFDEGVFGAAGGLIADLNFPSYFLKLDDFRDTDIADLLDKRLIHARLPIREPPKLDGSRSHARHFGERDKSLHIVSLLIPSYIFGKGS